jgi:hypothetical protein
MLSVTMLIVTNDPFMLSVIMHSVVVLNVIILNVMAPIFLASLIFVC